MERQLCQFQTVSTKGFTPRCCGHTVHMALGAANLVKQLEPFLGSLTVRHLRVTSGSFGGADESRKMVDIVQPVRTGLIVGFGSSVAELGYLVGEEACGDAHFVQVGIS